MTIDEFKLSLAELVKRYRSSGVCLGCLNQALILEVARNIETYGGLDWHEEGRHEADLNFCAGRKND